MNDLLYRTTNRIKSSVPIYLKQKNRMSAFKKEVIYKKLGLFKKMTEEERMLMLSMHDTEIKMR